MNSLLKSQVDKIQMCIKSWRGTGVSEGSADVVSKSGGSSRSFTGRDLLTSYNIQHSFGSCGRILTNNTAN